MSWDLVSRAQLTKAIKLLNSTNLCERKIVVGRRPIQDVTFEFVENMAIVADKVQKDDTVQIPEEIVDFYNGLPDCCFPSDAAPGQDEEVVDEGTEEAIMDSMEGVEEVVDDQAFFDEETAGAENEEMPVDEMPSAEEQTWEAESETPPWEEDEQAEGAEPVEDVDSPFGDMIDESAEPVEDVDSPFGDMIDESANVEEPAETEPDLWDEIDDTVPVEEPVQEKPATKVSAKQPGKAAASAKKPMSATNKPAVQSNKTEQTTVTMTLDEANTNLETGKKLMQEMKKQMRPEHAARPASKKQNVIYSDNLYDFFNRVSTKGTVLECNVIVENGMMFCGTMDESRALFAYNAIPVDIADAKFPVGDCSIIMNYCKANKQKDIHISRNDAGNRMILQTDNKSVLKYLLSDEDLITSYDPVLVSEVKDNIEHPVMNHPYAIVITPEDIGIAKQFINALKCEAIQLFVNLEGQVHITGGSSVEHQFDILIGSAEPPEDGIDVLHNVSAKQLYAILHVIDTSKEVTLYMSPNDSLFVRNGTCLWSLAPLIARD